MLLGTLVQTIVLLFITLRTDWEKQVSWLTVCLVLYSYLAMLFVIFIDNTWTARRFHIILNSSLFLFAGGECSREIEEMVHGREQKAAGLKGKSLNRKWTFVGSPKNI